MPNGQEKARSEVVARRTIRAGDQTDKQVKKWRKDLGDEIVDKLLAEQEA